MLHRHLTVKGLLSSSNPAVRTRLFQILAVIAAISIAAYLTHNTIDNLSSSGITSGLSFFDYSAGFGIVQHLADYEQGDTYGHVFVVDLFNTLLVPALCTVPTSVLGSPLGLARLSDNRLLRKSPMIYIETFCNISSLLQIFPWYFAVLRSLSDLRQAVNVLDLMFLSNRGLYILAPQMGGGFSAFRTAVATASTVAIGLFRFNRMHQAKIGQLRRTQSTALALTVPLPMIPQRMFGIASHRGTPVLRGFNFCGGMIFIPELAVLTLALSVYISAFIAEIIRAGTQTVPYGRREAVCSLGPSSPVTPRQVIILQMLHVITPPLISQYLNIVKNSSLVAATGYPDMAPLLAGTAPNQAGQAIETIAITMSVYLIISLSTPLLMNIYNRRIALVEC